EPSSQPRAAAARTPHRASASPSCSPRRRSARVSRTGGVVMAPILRRPPQDHGARTPKIPSRLTARPLPQERLKTGGGTPPRILRRSSESSGCSLEGRALDCSHQLLSTPQEHIMNKFAKGSLAAGAGLVLLLGGAGTLAYWNSEVELAGGQISSGSLTLEESDGALDVQGPEVLVPGDQKTFTADMVLTATGENLQGTVELDPATEDLLTQLGTTYDVDVVFGEDTTAADGFIVHEATAENPFGAAEFTGAGEYTFPVTITVTLPFGTEADNTTQAADLTLETVQFTATQTAAPNAVQ